MAFLREPDLGELTLEQLREELIRTRAVVGALVARRGGGEYITRGELMGAPDISVRLDAVGGVTVISHPGRWRR